MRLLLTPYQVREGFIIDDEDEEPEERERRRRKDKKRRRAEREEEEAVLDEEDLDLIGEANPEWERKTAAQVCAMGNSGYIQSNPPSSQNSSASSVDIETMANNIESVAWMRSSRMMRNSMRRMSSTADLPDQITTELTSSRTSSRKTN
jgi:hypothetical protein